MFGDDTYFRPALFLDFSHASANSGNSWLVKWAVTAVCLRIDNHDNDQRIRVGTLL